jgi:hypothetical protein
MNTKLLAFVFALFLLGCKKQYPQINLQIVYDNPTEMTVETEPGSFYFSGNQQDENLDEIKDALAAMLNVNNTHVVESNADFVLYVRKIELSEAVRVEHELELSTLTSVIDLNLVRAGSSGGNDFSVAYGDQEQSESYAEEDGSIYHDRIDISRQDYHYVHARLVREEVQDRLRRRY